MPYKMAPYPENKEYEKHLEKIKAASKSVKRFREHDLKRREAKLKKRFEGGPSRKYTGPPTFKRGPIPKEARESRIRKRLEEGGTLNLGNGRFSSGPVTKELKKLRTERRKKNRKIRLDKRESQVHLRRVFVPPKKNK